MPGLVGYLDLAGRPLRDDLARLLTQPLLHESYYITQRVASLPNTLAMIVDTAVDQRLCGTVEGSDPHVSLGFYGEFYGQAFEGAKRDDEVAAVLLRLYLKHGEALPEHLDGSFLVYIADFRDNTILIFNDHYASRPLFYSVIDGRFCFSPELKGVAAVPEMDRTLDPDAFVEFLLSGHLLHEQTFYKHVRPLLPGTVLKLAEGSLTQREYCRYVPCGEKKDLGEAAYVEELSSLLLRAMSKQLSNARDLMVPLSGGVDSRAILLCLDRLSGEKRSVSWGVEEGARDTDAGTARVIAERLGADHHFVRRQTELFEQDVPEMVYRIDGLNDDAAFHHNEMSAMRRIREEFGGRYVLRGEECFGPRPEARSDLEVLSAAGMHRLSDYPGTQQLLNPSLLPGFVERSTDRIQGLLNSCPAVDFTDRRDYFYFATRMVHYHTRSAYYKRTIVDVKNPWLDKDILKFMQTVPVKYRFLKYLYKKTLKVMFPDLMAVPIARTHNLENWPEVIRTNAGVQKFLRWHLLEDRNDFHELLNPDALRLLLEGALKGASQPSLKERFIQGTKVTMRERTPRLYQKLKPMLIGKLASASVPADHLLFRLLISKLWFDMFVHGKRVR